jgi:hypothetical protein
MIMSVLDIFSRLTKQADLMDAMMKKLGVSRRDAGSCPIMPGCFAARPTAV